MEMKTLKTMKTCSRKASDQIISYLLHMFPPDLCFSQNKKILDQILDLIVSKEGWS